MCKLLFLSTLSLRRATGKPNKLAGRKLVFLSTLSLRRATRESPRRCVLSGISIHALLAESDQATNGLADTPPKISIHALLAESDYTTTITICTAWIFLSTLSLRRATSAPTGKWAGCNHFYPRSPCGERHDAKQQTYPSNEFLSTLSLRRATANLRRNQHQRKFLSTLSLRRATEPATKRHNKYNVFLSTLSLRRATATG